MPEIPQRNASGALTLAIVLLLSPSDQAQIPNAATQFRISGRVVSAIDGTPLDRTRVTIADAKNPQNTRWVISSGGGRFDFGQLPAGKFSLQGAKLGFMNGAYEQHEQFSTAIVTGAGLDTEHLVLRLPPAATLSGKVLDEAGEAVRQAAVALYVDDHRLGISRIRKWRGDQTDDQGLYEFTRLDAGTYFIAVSASPWYAIHPPLSHAQAKASTPVSIDQPLDIAYPVTYYQDVTEVDEALPIPIRGGDHIEADIHLSPLQALHLFFPKPQNMTYSFRVPTLQQPSFDGMEDIQTGSWMCELQCELTGIPPGRYTVALAGPPESPASQTEMDLTTNQEVDGFKAETGSSVKALLKMIGNEALPNGLSLALRNRKLQVVRWGEISGKGEVEFPDVAPGKYEFLVVGPEGRYSVLRISAQNGTVSGHIFSVPTGQSLTLTLSLVAGTATVEGFAKFGGKPVAGAMVVLAPRNPEVNRELFRRDQSDLDGSFTLHNVIPGSYTVCAIEDGWDLDWGNAAVLAHYCQHGQRVIAASQVVHLSEAVDVQAK
jgi:Carboxypeptidase regulatory-like domain